MRALEVFESSGKSLTEHHAAARLRENPLPEYLSNLVFVAIHPRERATLHRQIAERYNHMLATGFVEEVKVLYERGDLHRDLPAIRSVGYRQVWDYLDGRFGYDTMVEKGIAATRQLAKRQLTWLRSWPDLLRLETDLAIESENIVKKCLNFLEDAAIN